MERITHWVGGAPEDDGTARTIPVVDPATGRQSAELTLGDADVVDRAVRAATVAQRAWGRASLVTRTAVMFRLRQLLLDEIDVLARIISAEHGKTVEDAVGEIRRGCETVDYVCGISAATKGEFSADVSTGVDVHAFRQPLGVVAGITPFNFPAMVPLWMHPVAIATGNAFVLKPSERDPSASMFVADLYRRAGLPDGVFSVVHGDKAVVDAILDHPGIAAVSFVGSTPVARYVQQRGVAAGKRVQALGGANNHAVVLPDADIAFAAAQIASGAFGSAGERCMAVPVAIAVGEAADPFVDELRRLAAAVVVGPGDRPGVEMGPLITATSRDRVVELVTQAVDAGAHAVVDGRGLVVAGYEGGHFVGPTVLDHVTTDMRAYREEVFGPVLTVLRVDTFEDALALVNSSPFGNGSAVFTSSGELARRYVHEVQAGMVGVNVPIPVPVAFYSFGGWKESLFGDHHAHGPEGVRFWTRQKVVTTRWPHQDRPVAASMAFPNVVA
ncbi:CoA-acylating methylmalonate-semialdehyde dehydrogenase [Cellulomonas soli]|uniref:methylmalonate-semialdehyde dehydrogenase (CoA acylating) n=1 Tax=Cellulomonas soli TaxID=931535 RepID=A0A512PDY5_9CELL|nr:CoA-acylating methylmalonate-semialdehyde dehydrogenase [Cellulomonas soli]NYI59085.1 malonate-semialdehyde dehydrogenase (acetylating)/methylmalonate-semialdehyde dehydrogenase [Cellulomonas soli]GEP69424.1 methylmalonate-semialdehyde dehydrogenase (acylating) [Cellulomonas soli]